MKKKIGTIIDAEIFKKLKIRAAEENRPMNLIIQEAIISHLEGDPFKKRIRHHALKRMLSNGNKL